MITIDSLFTIWTLRWQQINQRERQIQTDCSRIVYDDKRRSLFLGEKEENSEQKAKRTLDNQEKEEKWGKNVTTKKKNQKNSLKWNEVEPIPNTKTTLVWAPSHGDGDENTTYGVAFLCSIREEHYQYHVIVDSVLIYGLLVDCNTEFWLITLLIPSHLNIWVISVFDENFSW